MASPKKDSIMSMASLQRSAAALRRFLPAAIWRTLGALANGIITPTRFSLATGHWKSNIAMSARNASGPQQPGALRSITGFAPQAIATPDPIGPNDERILLSTG
jgi:hypothetical protein